MKVVHVTTSSKGGAGIAAFRLHEALRELGVSSAFISLNKTVDFEGREINDKMLAYRKLTITNRILRRLKSVLFPTEVDRLHAVFRDIKDQLNCEIATLPFSNITLEEHPLIQQADIIHLHWVSDILDYRSVFFKSN